MNSLNTQIKLLFDHTHLSSFSAVKMQIVFSISNETWICCMYTKTIACKKEMFWLWFLMFKLLLILLCTKHCVWIIFLGWRKKKTLLKLHWRVLLLHVLWACHSFAYTDVCEWHNNVNWYHCEYYISVSVYYLSKNKLHNIMFKQFVTI